MSFSHLLTVISRKKYFCMKFFQNRIVSVYPIIIFNWVFSSGYLPDFCVKFHTIPGPPEQMGIWGSPPFFGRLVHLL